MKNIAIIIFDQFTDIDLFLMWDLLGRNKTDWNVRILGTKQTHQSCNGLPIPTHSHLSESKNADVVLFSSGKGTRAAIKDPDFLRAIVLDPQRQLIGSICSGALILASLGLLKDLTATTHPRAKAELQSFGVKTLDLPLVCHQNIATAGGCLSAVYLVGWVIELLYGANKRNELIKEVLPVGQQALYESIILSSIQEGLVDGAAPDRSAGLLLNSNRIISRL